MWIEWKIKSSISIGALIFKYFHHRHTVVWSKIYIYIYIDEGIILGYDGKGVALGYDKGVELDYGKGIVLGCDWKLNDTYS